MRVIAGTAGGRRLKAPSGRGTRPTADRVKEALFSAVQGARGDLGGMRVLDLFAGSGALAIEALSRGAAHAVLVERDRRAAEAARANLDGTGLGDAARLVRGDAKRFAAAPAGGPFDLVLLDPPYDTPLPALHRLLAALRAAGALADGAVVVVERERRDAGLDAPDPPWLARERVRTYGDTVLVYYRAAASGPEHEEAEP